MKFVTGFHLTHFFIVLPALFISSCAGFNEAYDDRVCWGGVSGGVPIQCSEVFINFQCPENLASVNNKLIVKNKKIVIRPVVGYSAPKVGELFSHDGSIPIFVKNGSPWDTLHDDVEQILRKTGYEVRSNPDATESVIEADMKFLDVRSPPAGWFDLKGTTQATATFRVILRQSTGEELWAEDFTGTHQIKVSYYFLSDSENTLGQAYCRALENFAHVARSESFYNKLR